MARKTREQKLARRRKRARERAGEAKRKVVRDGWDTIRPAFPLRTPFFTGASLVRGWERDAARADSAPCYGLDDTPWQPVLDAWLAGLPEDDPATVAERETAALLPGLDAGDEEAIAPLVRLFEEQGSVLAGHVLAVLHETGAAMPQEYRNLERMEILACFLKAREKGFPPAFWGMLVALQQEECEFLLDMGGKLPSSWLDNIRQGAEAGSEPCLVELARAFWANDFLPTDEERALLLDRLLAAAERGNWPALRLLVELRLIKYPELFPAAMTEKILELVRGLADRGWPAAMTLLGRICLASFLRLPENGRAGEWLERGWQAGDPEAAEILAEYYLRQGTSESLAALIGLLENPGKAGERRLQMVLARHFDQLPARPSLLEDEQLLLLLRGLAALGEPDPYVNFAWNHLHRHSTPDLQPLVAMLNEPLPYGGAADCVLGLARLSGFGCVADRQAGLELLEKAAEAGSSRAVAELAQIHLWGLYGCPTDSGKGLAWLDRGLAQSNPRCLMVAKFFPAPGAADPAVCGSTEEALWAVNRKDNLAALLCALDRYRESPSELEEILGTFLVDVLRTAFVQHDILPILFMVLTLDNALGQDGDDALRPLAWKIAEKLRVPSVLHGDPVLGCLDMVRRLGQPFGDWLDEISRRRGADWTALD